MIRGALVFCLCVSLLVGIPGLHAAQAEAEQATVSVKIGGAQPIQDGKSFTIRIEVRAPANQPLKRAVVRFNFELDNQSVLKGKRALDETYTVSFNDLSSVTFDAGNASVGFTFVAVEYSFTVLEGASKNLSFSTGDTVIYPVVGAGYRLYPNLSYTIQLAGAQPPVHEHTFSLVERASSTCTVAGYERFACDACDEGYSLPLPAAHAFQWMEYAAPSCDLAGERREQCTACGEYSGASEGVSPLTHTWSEGHAEPDAACETDGTMHYTCTRASCLQQKTESISATGHVSISTESLLPTCMVDGYQRDSCDLCGKVVREEIYGATGHQFPDEWITEGDDCTLDSVRWRACLGQGCEETQRETLSAHNQHALTTRQILASCDTDGANVFSCSRCSHTVSVIVPALGHTYGLSLTNVIPTCMTEGQRTATCDACGDEKTETLEITPNVHDFSDPLRMEESPGCETWGTMITNCRQEGCDAVFRMQVQPDGHRYEGEWQYPQGYDCALGGTRYKVCTVCKNHRLEETILPGQHVLQPWITRKEATCKETGLKTATCTICSAVISQTLPLSTIHNATQSLQMIREQSCTQTGLVARLCKDCGKILFQLETQKLPHTYLAWVLRDGGTCEKVRYEDSVCTVCTQEAVREIPAGTHAFPAKWEVLTAPGCTTEGEERRTCAACNHEVVRAIAPMQHSWSAPKLGRASTCWEAGFMYNDCIACDARKEQPLKLEDHQFPDWEIGVQNSCLNEGLKTRKCSIQECGAEETEVLPQLQHDYLEWESVIEATCTALGEKSSKCTLCSTLFTEEIPVLPHEYGEFAIVQSPACGVEGLQEKTCTVCGNAESEAVKQLWHVWTGWSTLTQPGCAVEGSKLRTCTLCGVEDRGTIPGGKHVFGKWGNRTYQDCTLGGYQERVCETCGASEHKAVDGLKHHFAAWQEVLSATCSSVGEQMRACRRCAHRERREVKEKTHRMGPWESEAVVDCVAERAEWRTCKLCDHREERLTQYARHHFYAWKVVKAATCHAGGLRERICQRCAYTERGEIADRKHTFTKWAVQTAATCSGPGIKTRACKRCGETEERSINQKKHRSAPWRTVKPAQLFKAGMQARLCRVCGETLATRTYSAPKSSFAVTFSSFGLSLQDIRPGNYESWYMVSPIDLTHEGEAFYPLIADNKHVIGMVVTSVSAGKLTANVELFDERTEILKPSLRFFNSLDNITEAALLRTDRSIGFGRTINIARSFGNARVTYLAVRCEGIYDSHSQQNPLFTPEGAMPDGTPFAALLDSFRNLAGLKQ